MIRVRTISEAILELRAADPGTKITQTAIRRLVKNGDIPSVKIGAKYLINMEVLEDFLSGSMPTIPGPTLAPGIRSVEENLNIRRVKS